MTNPEKALPEVELELWGATKKLVFSVQAFCILEETTGKNALDGDNYSNPDARTLSALLWAGLITHHKDISLDFVRSNLSLKQLMSLYPTILKAFNRASSEEKKSDVEPTPPPL